MISEQDDKMQVEIWSDVMCPFCYIGKRKFELALEQIPNKDKIDITWKSYQLSPELKTDKTLNINQYLSKHKGIPLTKAEEMNAYVTEMASKVGLEYRFDKAIVANSFMAHCFSHYAKQYGKQNELEEKLFAAYFSEGKNIDNLDILLKIGEDLGLNREDLSLALTSNAYSKEIENDINEAQKIGVHGVPFFVFDRKYAISGAQESSVFFDTIQQSLAEWEHHHLTI